jgi:hypothetical protein
VTADFFEEREKEEAREQENIFDDIIIKCRVIGFRVSGIWGWAEVVTWSMKCSPWFWS